MEGREDVAAYVLTKVVVVLEAILKNLNARELNKCARVCKMWSEQVKREKESREHGRIRWNCYKHSRDAKAGDEFWNRIKEFILESPTVPSCVLIFCTETLWSDLMEADQGGKKTKQGRVNTAQLFSHILPADCVHQIVVTDGIIGTDSAMVTTEMEEFDKALSLIMFSELPGVEYHSFGAIHKDMVAMAEYDSSAQTPRCLSRLLNKKVKMVNLYGPLNGIDPDIGYTLYRVCQWPLIVGGYVNGRHCKDSCGGFNSSEQNCIMSSLAISGQEVKVASILIRHGVETIQEVDRLMKELKKHNLPLHHSFGLMYACIGRGVHMYGEHDVESKSFRSHFPNTPLIGFFGNGEIGFTYPIEESKSGKQSSSSDSDGSSGSESDEDENLSAAQKKRKLAAAKQEADANKSKRPPKLLHAYTTVMCLVSLP